MNTEYIGKRVWGAACVCVLLCFFSLYAFAQERASDPPKEDQTQENRAVLDFQKPEKVIQDKKADQTARPVIRGKTPKPEPRASGYLKIGDIKGDSTPEAGKNVPAHTPEWTNDKTGDPGRADDKHNDWINLDSVSNSASGQQSPKMKITQAPQGYECPQGDSECYCHGVLDCKNLWTSGVCKENSEWEDGNDPSKGGCIED